MIRTKIFIGLLTLLTGICRLDAQRIYAPNSVLASGSWYKVGVKQEGIYKVDIAFLNSLGISTSNLSSASVRLFGNGGGMLDENNATPRTDDLFENPIEMVDGGDGIFNGLDYFLFYAPGPNRWIKDSTGLSFRHSKNRYADTAWYYISVGGVGKRIAIQTGSPVPNNTVTSYDERYFYENDLVNLLNSGKEWYGEAFNTNFGGNTSRSFSVDWPGLLLTQPVTIVSDLACRSVGNTGSFLVKINNQLVQSVNLAGVSGNFLDFFANSSTQKNTVNVAQTGLSIAYTFSPQVNSAQGWLNWFELFGRRSLAMNGNNPVFFRDWLSVAPNSVAGFSITNNANVLSVWDITDPLQPVKMNAANSATQTTFSNQANRLREYMAFTLTNAIVPFAIGKINNQNLHNSNSADYIIITHSTLLSEAQRLAQFHFQRDGYRTVVATTDQVFQEFSSGTPDPTALRDFVKMYFDKAGADLTKRPKYLLLMGSASYDYRNRISSNANLVPGYESPNSLDPLSTYTSDDFFGFLDDGEDINQNNNNFNLDIGIGRIPARNIEEAKIMVDKIIRYHSKTGLGAWRNQSVFIADDQDQNIHLNDAESVSADANAVNSILNQYKIYLDAYPVVSNSSGARYPAVNDAIVNQVFNGSLIVNYSGHGSYQRLAEEAILTQDELNRFNNPDKLPLFITASCDFAPHDDPSKNSLGGSLLMGGANGAIALLTTTRLVFAFSNRVINDNYLQIALKPEPNGQYLTLGESVRRAKNFTSLSSGDLLNNRKFTLLGDPAMKIGLPEWKLQLTSLNGQPMLGSDTLRPLQKYTFNGIVTDGNGNPLTSFNGMVHPTVFDKPQSVKTLGNDPTSIVTSFNQQSSVLYKGNATVSNGKFSFSFIVPKDINYQSGRGRISLYADNGTLDASGVNTSFFVGGTGNAIIRDNTGPEIKPYLNDDKFLNGGLTNENPVLLIKLYDSSGINTSGNGIGHDITAVIDGVDKNIFVLNNFYTADQDSYQQGQVLFQLPTLTEGKHSIRIKAWDVANNSNEETLDFVVVKQVTPKIIKVRNYPNPFSESTIFAFEHNQPNTELDVTINIYQMAGGLVKQIKQKVNTGGTRNCQISWKGDNQSGVKLTKGVYIYKIMVVAGDTKMESAQQLLIF